MSTKSLRAVAGNKSLFGKAKRTIDKYNQSMDTRQAAMLQLVFKIGDFDIVADLNEELHICSDIPAEVQAEMAKCPARYAYWASLFEEITNYEAKEKVKYDLWFNQHFVEIALDGRHKRDSDSRVSRFIFSDNTAEYKEWMHQFNEIGRVKGRLKVMIKAYEYKMDMLRSIGAMIRIDMSNQPRL